MKIEEDLFGPYQEGYWDEDMNEDAMGGVSAPMATLNNTPGVGNAVPATDAAMTGSQQASPSSTGSGDKWGGDDMYDQKGKVKTKKKKKKADANETNLNPYDKIGAMMAARLGIPQTFKKGDSKTNTVKQETFKEQEEPTFKIETLDNYVKASKLVPDHPLTTIKKKKVNEDFTLSGPNKEDSKQLSQNVRKRKPFRKLIPKKMSRSGWYAFDDHQTGDYHNFTYTGYWLGKKEDESYDFHCEYHDNAEGNEEREEAIDFLERYNIEYEIMPDGGVSFSDKYVELSGLIDYKDNPIIPSINESFNESVIEPILSPIKIVDGLYTFINPETNEKHILRHDNVRNIFLEGPNPDFRVKRTKLTLPQKALRSFLDDLGIAYSESKTSKGIYFSGDYVSDEMKPDLFGISSVDDIDKEKSYYTTGISMNNKKGVRRSISADSGRGETWTEAQTPVEKEKFNDVMGKYIGRKSKALHKKLKDDEVNEEETARDDDNLKDTNAKKACDKIGLAYEYKPAKSGKYRTFLVDPMDDILLKIEKAGWEEIGKNPENTVRKYKKGDNIFTIYAEGKNYPRATLTTKDILEGYEPDKTVSSSLDPYL